jgi:hypothetical protein
MSEGIFSSRSCPGATITVRQPALVGGALGTMTLAVAIMSITRHQVRALYLAPFTAQTSFVVAPQWGNFLLFVVLLIAGLITVAHMVRRVVSSPASGAEAA